MRRPHALEVDESARLELEAVGQTLSHRVADLDAVGLAEGLESNGYQYFPDRDEPVEERVARIAALAEA